MLQGAAPGPRLLVTGGVHGDEFEPMAAIRRLAELVVPRKLCGRLTLAPCVNEAAFENQHRTAADGLDLARVCPGDLNGSITQRTAHALAGLIRDADFYIDLHTGGTIFAVLPLVGYTLHQDPRVLDAQRAMARAFNLPLVWGTTSRLEGRSLSVARDANVPAIYAEYGGSATLDRRGVQAYVRGCMNVMRHLGMLTDAGPAPESVVRYVVEDEREGSGHMQAQNGSPMDGFFEPAVELGQCVRTGDLLGVVSDVTGERKEAVACATPGIVVTLRTFCRVKQGDSLGVIVDVDRSCGG